MGEQCIPKKKIRSSNIELMRIVLMVIIIMHHYVVNSGIMDGVNLSDLSVNVVFLQYWGMWGKMAINAYVMVSGFFLCTSSLTWQKYMKLLLQILFYQFVLYAILIVLGYATLAPKEMFKTIFALFYGAGNSFVSSFMLFYLFVPYLNKLLDSIKNKGGVERLLVLLFVVNTVTVTFFKSHAFNEITWYMNIYFVGAYLRLYAGAWSKRLSFSVKWLLLFVALSFISIAVLDAIGMRLHKDWGFSYYFMIDSSKILAFFVSIGVFLLFKNLPMKHSHFINVVAKTTFGVLLIHAHSDAMRTLLWKHLADVPSMLHASTSALILHAMIWAPLVFIVCSALDYLRIRYLEPPVMNWIYKNSDTIEAHTNRMILNLRTMGKKIVGE